MAKREELRSFVNFKLDLFDREPPFVTDGVSAALIRDAVHLSYHAHAAEGGDTPLEYQHARSACGDACNCAHAALQEQSRH